RSRSAGGLDGRTRERSRSPAELPARRVRRRPLRHARDRPYARSALPLREWDDETAVAPAPLRAAADANAAPERLRAAPAQQDRSYGAVRLPLRPVDARVRGSRPPVDR